MKTMNEKKNVQKKGREKWQTNGCRREENEAQKKERKKGEERKKKQADKVQREREGGKAVALRREIMKRYTNREI